MYNILLLYISILVYYMLYSILQCMCVCVLDNVQYIIIVYRYISILYVILYVVYIYMYVYYGIYSILYVIILVLVY